MLYRYLVLAAILATGAALAATGTYTWTNATKNADGSPLPASGAGSISSTVVEYSVCGTGDVFGTKIGEVVRPDAGQSAVRPDLPPGRYCNRAAHRNTYGNQGPWSDVAVLTIDAPTPGKPTNFSGS